MPLLSAIPFLKGAVARSLPGGAPSIYTFHEGSMYARNAAVLSCYPMPHILGSFALAAEVLERALGRMEVEPQIGAGDGTLILKSGRLKSELTLLACDPPTHTTAPASNEQAAAPTGLMAALQRVRPFIDENGTWNRSAKLEQGRILAISNRSAIEAHCELEVPEDAEVILTDEAVEYLAGLPNAPQSFRIERDAVWLTWDNGAWVRCQLSALSWPMEVFDRILASAGTELPIAINDEWRAAFADAVALGDRNITIKPTGIYTRTEQGEHLGELETGVTRETFWSAQTLKPMFDTGANAWNPDAETGPAAFAGPGFRGVVQAQRG